MVTTFSIEDMRRIATEKGGLCLSELYVNQLTKLKWQCAEGHVWETLPKYIRKGTWCPTCARKSENRKKVATKLSIDDMRIVAEERGGKCISDEYIALNKKLKWKCEEGHVWEAVPSNVRNGSWCPTCARQNQFNRKVPILTIDGMKKMAEELGGKCLSETYTNSVTKLKWECEEGHIWEATPTQLRQKGTWCPTCAQRNFGKYQQYDMGFIKKLAEDRGGKCLSDVCASAYEKLSWQCEKGHIWETAPINIVNGSWCAHCAGKHKYSIEKMHEIASERGGKCLSATYKNVFTKISWECSNGHHFDSIPKHIINGHWCPNCTNYLNEERCRFILETLFDTKFIKNRTVLNGYELDGYNEALKLAFEYHGIQHYEQVDFFYSRGDMNLNDRIERDRLKEKMCVEKGIDLLVIPYTIEPEDQMNFIVNELFSKGFKFKVEPSKLTFENFYFVKKELKEIQELAEANGGKCLSDVYNNSKSKMDFICEKGHKFSKTAYNIKNGQWCRTCSYEKRGDLYRFDNSEMHKIAEENGWVCLSIEYKNARTKLQWQCAEGHIFNRTLDHVKRGNGCPICRKEKV